MSRRKSPTSNCVSGLYTTNLLSLMTLRRLKHLVPVHFSFHTSSAPARSEDSTPAEGSSIGKKEDQQGPICPSCKKELNNNVIMHGVYLKASAVIYTYRLSVAAAMKPCAHVICKTCTDSLVRPAKQCVVCDTKLGEKDIFELKREGAHAMSFYYCRCLQLVA
jgi:nitric oxide synthase-interacting protein